MALEPISIDKCMINIIIIDRKDGKWDGERVIGQNEKTKGVTCHLGQLYSIGNNSIFPFFVSPLLYICMSLESLPRPKDN